MSERAAPRLEPDDLLRMPDGDIYELIDGVPVEKTMGAESDGIGLAVGALLQFFVRAKASAGCSCAQTGYRCFPNPRQLRKPDVSFVARGRFPNDKPPKGDIDIAPDLAVEVVSPKDLYVEIAAKVADYKSAKVRLIWVVTPETRTVLVRRADGSCAELDETGELSGEDVVPGFTCEVAELFV